VEHVCNSGIPLWNWGKEEGKENDRASVILPNIRCEGRGYKDVRWKLLKTGGGEIKGKGQ
jgi:hypothetical protein